MLTKYRGVFQCTVCVQIKCVFQKIFGENVVKTLGEVCEIQNGKRIVRKNNVSSPTGKVIVIYDYFEHGAGDLMTVDSYVDIADQMTYEDIPTYTASKIDPDTPSPTGAFPLYDTYDFRPRVENITGTSSEITTTDEITGNSFDFFSRQFDGTGASTVDTPKPGSFIQADFEYYLPRSAIVSIPKKIHRLWFD